jgi:DNA primase
VRDPPAGVGLTPSGVTEPAKLANFEIVGILGLGPKPRHRRRLGGVRASSAMAAIPEQIIERIRESVDIVDVIGGHVGLKRSGKQYKGLCPFHEERSPSFYVDPVRRSFKCFGCGAWGDAFDFVQKVEGVGFLAAVRSLGLKVGVALPDQSTGDVRRAEARERERERAYQINGAAAEVFRQLLLEAPIGEAGRAYQEARGIDAAIAASFQIGYAPAPSEAGWDTLVRELERRELPLDVAETLGLVARSPRGGGYYDRFRGRLMFPIIAPGGRVLGFSGRILPSFAEAEDGHKAPKYVNSPESLLYKKSRTLFGLHSAGSAMREKGRAILVEGQVDVVAMHQRGYTETVAPLGTALTQHQCDTLARFTDTVVLCFDGDQAGTKAAYAALPLLLATNMDVRIAALDVQSLGRQLGRGPDWMPTQGEDPDSTARDVLDNLLARPRPAILWFLDRTIEKGALQSIEAKERALNALVPLIRSVQSLGARTDYAGLAAGMLQIPAERVWAAVGAKLLASASPPPSPRAGARTQDRFKQGEGKPGKDRRPGTGKRQAPKNPGRSAEFAMGSAPRQKSGFEPSSDSGFDSGFDPGFDPSFDPSFDPGFDSGFEPSFESGFEPSFEPSSAPAFDRADPAGSIGARGPTRGPAPDPAQTPSNRAQSRAESSQFSAGMPHSAAMRPVPPLPSGQASVTALLVDRPELARVAERQGVLERVTDIRLQPIVNRVIRAALDGESIPSEGELLELVDVSQHRLLHARVFAHEYLEVEDPQTALEHGLVLCERDHLEHEVRALEGHIAEARSRGDLDSVHELVTKRMAARRRQHELQASLRRD